MTVDLPGHSAPTAGFEAPIEMLSACHHRIERQCATLRRPALIESMAGSDAFCLRALTDRLTADHRQLDAHWQRVRSALVRLVA